MLRFNNPFTYAALSVLALQACTVEVIDFDPRGFDVALEASWEIDGAPADATRCAAAGIDTVELVFVRGSLEYRYPEFIFRCADGAYSNPAALERGTYSAFWEAQDAAGNALQVSGTITVDATGDVARPDIPDFSTGVVTDNDAVLSVTWDTDITTEIDGADCATVEGVDFMAYALFDEEAGEPVKDYMWSAGCADEITIPGDDLVVGTSYRVDIDGGPEEGLLYWQASCYFTAEEGGTTASCEAADVRYRLGVDVQWDMTLGPGANYGTCAEATVAYMAYELVITDDGTNENALAGMIVAADSGIDCAERFEFSEPVVVAGIEYDLRIWGSESDPDARDEWILTYGPLTAAPGIMENDTALVDR